MMAFQIELTGEKDTDRFGRRFARLVLPADVLALRGDLGAGKTRWVKGLAAGLGIDPDDVGSPTFKIIGEYHGRLPLYHMDFYRLKSVEEAEGIGVEEYFYSEGICAVEWADRLEGIIPASAVWLHFSILEGRGRIITVSAQKDRAKSLMASLDDFHPQSAAGDDGP